MDGAGVVTTDSTGLQEMLGIKGEYGDEYLC